MFLISFAWHWTAIRYELVWKNVADVSHAARWPSWSQFGPCTCAPELRNVFSSRKETLIGPKEKKKKTSTAVKKALESWTDSGSPTLSTEQESTKRMCSTTGTWRKEENVSDFSHRDVSRTMLSAGQQCERNSRYTQIATTNLQIVTVAMHGHQDHVAPPALGRRWLINGRWMFFSVRTIAIYRT
jgi:hypothetical protein